MAPFLIRLYTWDKEIESRWISIYWNAIDMLAILLMIVLYLWLIGVGIAAYALLRNCHDYE